MMQDKIEVFLDNSVFNLLFDISKSGGDLNDHLPSTEFDLWITPEVRIEIDKIPASKAEKKAFIIALLAERRIRTDFPLGFADPNRPGDSLRYGGLDVGRFYSRPELTDALAAPKRKLNPKTGHYKGEADALLAARSHHRIVLTMEKMKDRTNPDGPLQAAQKSGRAVISLHDFDLSKQTLRDFINSAAQALKSPPTARTKP